MKLLFIGDIHGKKSSFETVKLVLDNLEKTIKENDIEKVFFMGDINDSKANIRAEIQNLFFNYFLSFQKELSKIHFYLLVWNHDYVNSKECKEHSLEAFKVLSNVTVIDSVLIEKFNKKVFCFIPYMNDNDFISVVKEQKEIDYFCIHQDVAGFKYNDLTDRVAENSILPELFLDSKVISGHIHKPDEKGNILYVGTPYQESFSEAGQAKRLVLLDLSNKKGYKFLELENIPKYENYVFTINELEELKEVKKSLKKSRKGKNDKDHVRLCISAPEEICHKIKKSLFEGIEKLKVEKITNVSKKIYLSEGKTNKDIMQDYLKQVDIPDSLRDNVYKWNNFFLSEEDGV